VAAQNARAHVEECLTTLTAQGVGESVEVVMVDNSTDGTANLVREKFPQVRVLTVPGRVLVPDLWEAGIRQSGAAIVALTTAHFVPQEGWVRGILTAHRKPVAGVGGTITCDPRARLLDWAVYFCRYSPYMLPCREGPATEIAGDNASYKRAAIEECPEARRNGFWEAHVHAELRRAGHQLWLDPSIGVVYQNSFRFGGFMRQRFVHGMSFARDQSDRLSRSARALRSALWPAIPPRMLIRIARRVFAGRRHRRELVRALSVLTMFLTAWALGEAVGYLRGRRR
jgi:hypothetical protein